MASDKQFKDLLTDFKRAKAENQDLREQIKQKEAAWSKEREKVRVMEDTARTLCESILAKDKSEMVLQQDYSWRSIGTTDLLKKAINSYKNYCQERSELLTKIQDVCEARGKEIESLTDQIIRGMTDGTGQALDPEAVQKIIADAEKEKEKVKAIKKAPFKAQDAAKEGKINLIVEDEGDIEFDGEKRAIQELIDINEEVKTTSMSIPVAQSTARKRENDKRKEASMRAHVVNLQEFADRMNDMKWEILYAIGNDGFSKYPDIENSIVERNPEMAGPTIRKATSELESMTILSHDKIRLPLTPISYIYRLSEIGSRLYFEHFGKKPVVSEVEKIIAEHDNVEHGYGIIDVATMLTEKGWYDEVSAFNRVSHKVVLGKKSYVPDIYAEKDGQKEYFEYERGLHTQNDFNEKCNKMVQVTRVVNFIAPNVDVLKKALKPKIEAWAKKRGQESLRNVKVRLTTARQLKENDKKDDGGWLIIYNFNKSLTPVKDIN